MNSTTQQNKFGGNTMSSKKTAQRRIGLLAGSSLVAASLSAFAFTGMALAPTAALADNECVPVGVDPSANGGTPDDYVCNAPIGTYVSGVTYSSDGDLTVESTINNNEFGGNGIQLTGNGGDNVTFVADGVEIEGRDLVGVLLDITTDTGNIDITTGNVDADGHNATAVTGAIRAISTGGGDIDITTTGSLQASISAVPDEAIGLEARSAGGDISITTGSSVNGKAAGMLLETSGSGGIDLNLGGTINTGFLGVGIDATAGTGGFSLTINSGGVGRSLIVTSTGGAEVNLLGGDSNMSVDFSGVTGGGVIFNTVGISSSNGRWRSFSGNIFSNQADVLSMSGPAVSVLEGANAFIDFSAGDDTFNLDITEYSITRGASILFGPGDDEFNVTRRLITSDDTLLNFGADDDTFNLPGALLIGTPPNGFGNPSADRLTISNLETLNFSGTILLGFNAERTNSDAAADDVLIMSAGTFNGLGGRVFLDAFLGSETQPGCAVAVAADCLDLRGASTTGVTPIVINNVSPFSSLGEYNPVGVTVVDVAGAGTSGDGHFVIDPATQGYIDHPLYGDAVDRAGLFVYALQYDAANQRHVIVGLPRPELFEYNVLSSAAQSIWHMTAKTVTDRQTDLRGAPDTGSVWMRTTGEFTERDMATDFATVGGTFLLDNSYELYAGTITAGMDLIQGRSGDLDYVVGAQIGYVGSSLDFAASSSNAQMTGATGGIYGSIWNSRVFLDATFNMNGLALEYDSPALRSKTNTYTTAFGARLEGGMRYRFSEVLFAEPLINLAFVRTGFEELSFFGGEVRPEDSQSRRGALGLRVGGDIDGQVINWSYFVTGRAWSEFDGESEGVINNAGADLMFADEFDGSFGEAEAGLSLYNDANTLSGFAATGVKWKDGYSAIDLSLGLRMSW